MFYGILCYLDRYLRDFPLDYVQQHQIPLVSLYYSIDGNDGVNGCPKSEELKTFYSENEGGR